MAVYEICVVGGGLVGLATARSLLEKRPGLRLILLEKEESVAAHQSGHNSGVIHRGLYYKPGTLKAQLCVAGAERLLEYCAEHEISVERVGKVIVAITREEMPRLDMIYERAQANRVPGVVRIARGRLLEIEPHAAGLEAVHSPETAIVDYTRVAAALRNEIEARDGLVQTGARVTDVRERTGELIVETSRDEVRAHALVNCAGLYADTIARLAGHTPDVRIIPFRGEYYTLKAERAGLVRGLIYPVADPQLPFLGVHLTRTIRGEVHAGPNAVLAFAREGYTWSRVSASETAGALGFTGFWKMAGRWWHTGAFEMYRSLSKRAFVRSLQKLVPELSEADLAPGGSGVRAQAVNRRGELLDDFCFVRSGRALHVLNAPSPAATACLSIGAHIAAMAPLDQVR